MNFQLQEKLNEINALRAKNKELRESTNPEEKEKAIADSTFDLMEKITRNVHGDVSKGRASIREALTTTDTVKLIPKIIEGKLREAAEPEYLGTRFFSTINVDSGNTAVYTIPVVGELVAYEVGEGQRYREDYVDYNVIEDSNLEIRVSKVGTKVTITEEAIADSSWDILGINVKKMGRAMARFKEEKIFNNFSKSGNTIFENRVGHQMEQFETTGRGIDGKFNGTLSVEDMLDMCLTLMGNGFTATDIIMHPLTWVIFARNSMIGNGLTFGAFGGGQVHPWGAVQGTPGFAGLAADGSGQKMIMKPEQVQNRLPMPLTINFSPFVKFDKNAKTFDMYCLDRSEVGVIVQKEGLSTENWTDPERDIRNLKCKERYGIGILNSGRAITVAKGLKVDTTHPVPPTVTVNTVQQ